MVSNFHHRHKGKKDMIGIGVIIAALGIVGLLILGMFRAGSFPPNARLLCDVWAAVEQKTTYDNTVSIPKKNQNRSSKQEV
jgi:hypothetical protein